MHRHCHGGIIPALTSPSPAPDDLSGLTKAQLLELAGEMGVEGVSGRMTKAAIINAIEEG